MRLSPKMLGILATSSSLDEFEKHNVKCELTCRTVSECKKIVAAAEQVKTLLAVCADDVKALVRPELQEALEAVAFIWNTNKTEESVEAIW